MALVEKDLIGRSLIVFGIGFVMFSLLLITSDSIYIYGERLSEHVIYASVVVGIIGCGFFITDMTSLRYLAFWPIILSALLVILAG